MGVKYFFSQVKNKFPKAFTKIINNENTRIQEKVDVLAIDMNGLYHASAQRVYKYGKHAVPKSLLRPDREKNKVQPTTRDLSNAICTDVDRIIKMTQPKKTVVLCVDGIAGYAKSYQQRQRRFRYTEDITNDGKWSSINLSVGTTFMEELSNLISKQIPIMWPDLDIVWSCEKTPGEGEQKIMSYIRKYVPINDSICIHGMDADIIMLAMATQRRKVYILRDDHSNDNYSYVIDVNFLSYGIYMSMEPKKKRDVKRTIDDFIFLCFLLGNDFLPNIPSLETIRNGLDTVLYTYHYIKEDEYIIDRKKTRQLINKSALDDFLFQLEGMEEHLINQKLNDNRTFYDDALLELHTTKNKINLPSYIDGYVEKHFSTVDISTVSKQYLEGLEWVFKYYTRGMPCWTWVFHDQHAPFISHIRSALKTYKTPMYKISKPIDPVHQLLMIIPPKASFLLPEPFHSILDENNFSLSWMFPDKVDIDLSGKYQEYEGIVVLPHFDVDSLSTFYTETCEKATDNEKLILKQRNTTKQTLLYKKGKVVCTISI